ILVLDTSGSMAGEKMEQARKALKSCLNNLAEKDRFGLINFATVVNKYKDGLTEAGKDQVAQAKKWVDELEATGGTAIYDALEAALEFRPKDESRTFTIVFFTDGLPTVGEGDKTSPEAILKNTIAKNTANTRIFTFGVGDDVNATLLDQLAYKTRARPTYVRPAEDIEIKVSGMYTKISHPVLTNLKLANTGDVQIKEVYPPQLPDLFHGSQLVVLGRYTGKGPAAIKLTGTVGKEKKELVYELTFPEKTSDGKEFVEHLWARRKVGYLLDQIRATGENKELVSEVVALAKKYGITTPYTSYLVVPDEAVLQQTAPLKATPGDRPAVGFGGQFGGQTGFGGMVGQFGGQFGFGKGGIGGFQGFQGFQGGGFSGGGGGGGFGGGGQGGFGGGNFGGGFGGQFGFQGGFQGGFPGGLLPPALAAKTTPATTAAPVKVLAFAQAIRRAGLDGNSLVAPPTGSGKEDQEETARLTKLYQEAAQALARGQNDAVKTGKLGVDLSIELGKLREQKRLGLLAQRHVGECVFQFVGGVWIDTAFKEKSPALVVKAQGEAYFRILERHEQAKDVFRLGNRLVWLTPSGTALVVDANDGKEKLTDTEIDKLFLKKQ
ncbi:MAG: VWA domain-containing protein, partial [Planctomycetes bacterium]|nr:VWA domain-containing protein [Planctomycetota bacterium]